jgi:hypothetical protein
VSGGITHHQTHLRDWALSMNSVAISASASTAGRAQQRYGFQGKRVRRRVPLQAPERLSDALDEKVFDLTHWTICPNVPTREI